MRYLPEKLGSKCTKVIKAKVFERSYNHELTMYLTTCQFEKAVYLISDIEKGVEEFREAIDKQHEIIFYFDFAYLYFMQQEYKKALLWCNKIINDAVIDIRQDVYCFARILNLLIHYELGNEDLLEYRVKSAYRYLHKRQRLYKFETSVLNFIRKKIPHIVSDKNLIGAFKELKTELEEITKDPFEKKAIEYFDFISWIESKIENRPFADIVRQKASKHLQK